MSSENPSSKDSQDVFERLTTDNLSRSALVEGPSFLTPFELYLQLFVFYLLFGLISTVCNFLITVCIYKYTNLKTRFFIILQCLTLWRTILSVQYVIIALYRILRQFSVVSVYQTRITCHSLHLFIYSASTIELVLLIALVIDRMLAIGASSFYRRLTRRQASQLCAIISGAVLVLKLVPSYFGIDLSRVIACVDMHSPTSRIFNAYNRYLEFSLAILLLTLYCVLFSLVRWHLKKLANMNETAESGFVFNKASFFKRTKLVSVVRNMILVHCAFEMTSKIMLFASNAAGVYSGRLVAYYGFFSTLNLLANVIVLLWTNTDIRKNMWLLVKRLELINVFERTTSDCSDH